MSFRRVFSLFSMCICICNLFAKGKIQQWPLPNIHSFGDSHSLYCFGTENLNDKLDKFLYCQKGVTYIVPITKRWIGPRIMHSFGIHGTEEKYFVGIREGDYVVFTLGAIDVNAHFDRQLKAYGRTVDSLVDRLVSSYLEKISYYQEIYKFIPILMGVIPPGFEPLEPDYAPVEKRILYTETLNKKLRESCCNNGLLYFDVNDEYSTEEGFLEPSIDLRYHVTPVHNGIIKKKLCDLIWENYYPSLE